MSSLVIWTLFTWDLITISIGALKAKYASTEVCCVPFTKNFNPESGLTVNVIFRSSDTLLPLLTTLTTALNHAFAWNTESRPVISKAFKIVANCSSVNSDTVCPPKLANSSLVILIFALCFTTTVIDFDAENSLDSKISKVELIIKLGLAIKINLNLVASVGLDSLLTFKPLNISSLVTWGKLKTDLIIWILFSSIACASLEINVIWVPVKVISDVSFRVISKLKGTVNVVEGNSDVPPLIV